MRVPVWLTLGVAFVVCVFGAYRIRLAFRSDEDDARARARKGLYAMGRRTHALIGVVYVLLGGALIATTFGWSPFAGSPAGDRAAAPPRRGVTVTPPAAPSTPAVTAPTSTPAAASSTPAADPAPAATPPAATPPAAK